MQLIKNNPYRIIGLLVGATAREKERHVRRLIQYIEAEQEPQDDFSLPALGNIHRSTDSVNEAFSKLNLDRDKLNAAVFWFYNGNAITDEAALEALKSSDILNAAEIWSKLTASGEVTRRSSSAFQNLSTLLLYRSFNASTINPELLEEALHLKLKFLESDFVVDFKTLVTDETFRTNKKEIQITFLTSLQREIEQCGGITSVKLIEILSRQEFTAKGEFLKNFVQRPVEQMEKTIEATKTKRKSVPPHAAVAGQELYDAVADQLRLLKQILGTSNLKYSDIADKVADEILQCGIEHFNHYRESSTDPGSTSMGLFTKANSLAVGNIVKQRCQENIENLQEWIDEKPGRERNKRAVTYLDLLKRMVEECERKDQLVSNAIQLLSNARPQLNNLKQILGSTDELYIGFSSRIAWEAQCMCVAEINAIQRRISTAYDSVTRNQNLLLLKQRVELSWELSTQIGQMDLSTDFLVRYRESRDGLSHLRSQLSQISGSSRPTSTPGGNGCYIATMAYGDYDHPQVLVLRQFRDNVLAKSAAGRHFIRIYYALSPKLVQLLKNYKAINTLIRITLNQFIKIIRR
jgi:hypothetical protein